ncbi:MAG: ribosome maturation factor RimM [Asticcacaulis sp.]
MTETPTADDRLILVGHIAGGFGVRGDVRITTYTADPTALLRYKTLLQADGRPVAEITGGRVHKDGLAVRLKGIGDKTAADALRGIKLYVPRSALPEPDEEEYYLADLIGLAVHAPEGTVIGKIRAVPNFGAGDLLEISPAAGGPTWYQPFTRAAVPEVRLSQGYVVIVPLTLVSGEDEG